MKRLLGIFILFALLASPLLSFAQGCAEPSSEEGVNLFGFFQPQFDYNLYDAPESNFGFNRARIGVMGNIPYDFSYYMVLETSPFKKGDPYLMDAFITYGRFANAKVSMGSFKAPFSLELTQACSGLHTINRSKVVSQLASPDRDMGMMLLGGNDTTLFRYAVAIMNGTGLLVHDDNLFKDIIGRVICQPADFVKFGGSFKYGKAVPAMDGAEPDTRFRFGGEIQLDWKGFHVQGEYIFGKDIGSYTTGGGCGEELEVHEGTVERDGMYVMALYETPWNIQPVIKYENYREDLSFNEAAEHITTFGVNYFFNEWTRLQVNYEYAAEMPREKTNDRIMVQLQVKF